ncbi:hypothetical protein Hanom_Chr14g01255371 [Helianthus anomalus]
MEHMKCHNQSLICALAKCTEANMALKNEKECKTKIEALRKDVSEHKKTVLNKQININNYNNTI